MEEGKALQQQSTNWMYYFHKIIGCRPEGPKSPPRGEATGKRSLSYTLREGGVGVITCKLSLKKKEKHDLGGWGGDLFLKKGIGL